MDYIVHWVVLTQAFNTDLEEFLYRVDLFAFEYFRPISPYKVSGPAV
jgi:hypothetical protein